jgi:hypothetical protein
MRTGPRALFICLSGSFPSLPATSMFSIRARRNESLNPNCRWTAPEALSYDLKVLDGSTELALRAGM